jgi:carboxylate-amine ligase
MSANSPWLAGEVTGMASNRAPTLAELPRAGAPPAFGSYGGWEAWVERLVALGVTADYTRIWWDVRPHPKLGTLEVRVPDQPTDVRLSAAFAALLQALCATALAGDLPPSTALSHDGGRADYVQNRWSAARFGTRAKFLHPNGSSFVPAAELGAELLDLVGPAARALGSGDVLDRLDVSACEADLQLGHDSPEAVAADLVLRSLG